MPDQFPHAEHEPEARRLAALDAYRILDTPPEAVFDELVRMVSELLNVPIAAVNLIAADRQWTKAEIGLGLREMPRDIAFCAQAIREPEAMIIPDATSDPRFADNPLVTGETHLRFYAGEVLRSREGLPLGAFCVADTRAHPEGLAPRQRKILRTLARQVMSHMELRRTIIERDAALDEQRLITEAHRTDDDFLRSVLAATGDCIEVLDLEARSVFMNESGLRAIGVSHHDEIRGLDWRTIWRDEAAHAAEQAVALVRAGGSDRFQARDKRPNKWWDVQLTPIPDRDGRPARMLSVARDMTASRDAADALGKARALNTAILNATSDLVMVLDLDGLIEYINPGGIEGQEIDPDVSMIGRSALARVHGEQLRTARAAFDEARAGRISRFRLLLDTFKGTPRRWDAMVSPLPGPQGLTERLLVVARDMTALKQTESHLALSEERLSLALGASDMIAFWEWHLDSGIVYGDANLAAFYGIDPEFVFAGIPFSELQRQIVPDGSPDLSDVRHRLQNGSGEHGREFRVLRADGSVRWLWGRGRTAYDRDGAPMRLHGATIDITDRKVAEAALRDANERLEERVAAALAERAEIEEALRQSQKMEAVGQLTGGLAHDFNNLLASIGGALEIMQTRIAQGRIDNLGRYIDAAQGAARRASALTHRLLAFSRRQTLDPRPTDVNQLVAGMQELICRTAGPEVSVVVVAEPELSNALIDPNQLENALLNLCINARDAMPGGGRLTIRTANCRLEGAAARDADVPAGLYTQLVVSDTGVGMPPEVVSRAFDPFFTTKPLGMGTGLGLSMVYGFVRQSGGMVAIDSAPGEGTSVRLHLPRHLGAAVADAPTLGSGAAMPAESGETILVVDDELTLRTLVAEVLQERGYRALEAEDGASGLLVLRSRARIDLLLTDVGLPGGMNGRQLADAARSLRPGLKVMFITGYAENAVLNDGNLEPGMEVLTKPFSMQVLANRIRGLVAR